MVKTENRETDPTESKPCQYYLVVELLVEPLGLLPTFAQA